MNISLTPIGFWEYLGIYRAKRWSGAPEVGTIHQGVPGSPVVPSWVVPSLGLPQAQPWPIRCLLVQKYLREVSLHLDSV